MKGFILLALVTFVAHGTKAKHCTDNSECTHECHYGYHGHCDTSLNKCECPTHTCQVKDDCPTGHGMGCPDGHAHCEDLHCRCIH